MKFVIHDTLLFANIHQIARYLRVGTPPTPSSWSCRTIVCNPRIALRHSWTGLESSGTGAEDLHSIRIWKTTSYASGLWYDDFSASHFVGALDYWVQPNRIKIEYFNVHDNEGFLNAQEANLIKSAMLDFTKNSAETLHKETVVIDVHHNLQLFDKYYREEGFVPTTRRCRDHPAWIETEYRGSNAPDASQRLSNTTPS